jgi:hypothetical protein
VSDKVRIKKEVALGKGLHLRFGVVITLAQGGRLWMAAGGMVYTGVACLCGTTWQKARRRGLALDAMWWGLMAVGHFFLALDAILGFRLAIAELGRMLFKEGGWYGDRKPVQVVLSVAALLIAAGVGWALLKWPRRPSRGCRLAGWGTLLSLLLFAVAAISMHQMDVILGWPFQPVSVGAGLRGLACVMTGAGAWRWHADARRHY